MATHCGEDYPDCGHVPGAACPTDGNCIYFPGIGWLTGADFVCNGGGGGVPTVAGTPTAVPTATNTPGPDPVPPVPPPPTISQYMKSKSPDVLLELGCDFGDLDTAGVIILDFGQPQNFAGTWGTLLFNNTFASMDEIVAATEGFLTGLYLCSSLTTTYKVGLGTSNYQGTTGFAHGQQWALAVNDLADILDDNHWHPHIQIVGASDIETEYNSPANSRAWAEGYDSVNTRLFYDYGNAGGCNFFEWNNQPCNNGWTQNDVWYVSWGVAAALPFPEIYLNNETPWNAAQWHRIALYSWYVRGESMVIVGVMSQWFACQQVGCDPSTDNTPAEAWLQLVLMFQAHPVTAQQALPAYSSDIAWQVLP
jgi:hypothetical protein